MIKLRNILFLSVMTLCLASCGDDDNPENPSSPESGMKTSPKSYTVDYTVRVADVNALQDIGTLEISYISADGKTHTDIMTASSTKWTKTEVFDMTKEVSIGLRARWILKAADVIQAAPQSSYNLNVSIESPYTITYKDNSTRESLFKSLSYQYVSDEYLTKEAIAEKAGKVKPFTSFCFNYKITENGFSFSTGAFPD